MQVSFVQCWKAFGISLHPEWMLGALLYSYVHYYSCF